MAARVGQVAVEVLVQVGTRAKLSQLAVETLIRLEPPVRMSQLAVEILAPVRKARVSMNVEFDQ